MNKICNFLFLTLCFCLNVSFAKPCVQNIGSCFKLNNQSPEPTQILCRNIYNSPFDVEAGPQSNGSTQFDSSLSDGLGYPDPSQMTCKITIGSKGRDFQFYNNFWGPTIEFTLVSDNHLKMISFDKWGSSPKSFEFRW